MADAAENDVVIDVHRGVGRILLNRPKALNALTTGMVAAIDRALVAWEGTPLSAVVFAGSGAKAFCAGGDIRTIREYSLAGDADASERFFATEYRLNARIAAYPVPIVSLIDGVCMGGGLGLSVHGAFRVVTEKAVLAMPETGIGFFPDIGASYFLPRLPGAIGMYLGLTGHRLDAADALYTGLATHFVAGDSLDAVADALADNPGDPVDVVLNRLAGCSPVAGSGLAKVRGEVDWAFGAPVLGEIEKRLHHLGTPWAVAALTALEAASPQSLEITHALLARGRQHTLRQCLDTELALTRTVIRTPDFLEGVRAALVDKDRSPAWRRAADDARTQPT
ncbi:enoyl-CoA hydratase/isomerase family protein [Streptomyces diastatochromogenes]|uniref:3-hydroxyisobutyryl-CoA hydrolase n=1 Tax=Streptomyces diastatochromogenes TaxID=42236 RepID=A0A233STZ6_STRDA|nr:enoyl-CoA hydratase/isomerase family protein [Streptomyces diastatochromogenes]MCZ0985974.1 enoyl-CoA hydratase/isomerase family protein [Streptomyces diastatochromogenes]OXY99118.1 enoyl-CoA hydratase [Streptomyces diastatochromogenes]